MNTPRKLKYFAGGEWLETNSNKYMDVFNPSTGEVQAQTPCCTKDEVEYAIKCAKNAFPAWSDTPVAKRVQVVLVSIMNNQLVVHDHIGNKEGRDNLKNWQQKRTSKINF